MHSHMLYYQLYSHLANNYYRICVNFIFPLGGYYLDDIAGFMNVYDRAQNVIVKLHGAQNDTEHSLLVNSHFDTVPASPGNIRLEFVQT